MSVGRYSMPRPASRPIYENSKTLKAEDRLKERIEVASGWRLHKLPMSHVVDYAATHDGKNEIVGWLELKCRTNDHNRYKTYIVSLNKWRRLVELGELSDANAVLVVEFTDGIWFVSADKSVPISIAMGGRTDRNDKADIEPLAHIDMREFKNLKQVTDGE